MEEFRESELKWRLHAGSLERVNPRLFDEVRGWPSVRVLEAKVVGRGTRAAASMSRHRYWFRPEEVAMITPRVAVEPVPKKHKWIAYMGAESWAKEASWSVGEPGNSRGWGRVCLPEWWNGGGVLTQVLVEEEKIRMFVGQARGNVDETMVTLPYACQFRPSRDPVLPRLIEGVAREFDGPAFLVGVLGMQGEGLGSFWEDEKGEPLGWVPVNSVAEALRGNGEARRRQFGPSPHWELIEATIRQIGSDAGGFEV